jgi:O-antigen/teichoic acid export membrane protein
VGGGFAALLNTAQAIVAARWLGSAEYGYFALVVAAVGLVMQFSDFRTWEVLISLLPRALSNEVDDHPQDIVYSLFLIDLFSGAFTILAVLLLSGILAGIVANDVSLKSLINTYAWIAPGMLISNGVLVGVLRILDKFAWITAKSIASSIVQLSLVVAALSIGFGLRGVLISVVVSQYFDMAVGLIMALHAWKTEVDKNLPKPRLGIIETMRRHGRYLVSVWLSGTIKGIQNRVDVLLLGYFASPSAVGKYRLSLDLVGNLARLGSPVQDTVLPIVSELEAAKERIKIRRIIAQITGFLTALLIPVLVVVIFFGETIVLFLLGADYKGTGEVLAILTIGITVNTIFIWARPLLIAQLKVKEANLIAIAGGVFEVLLIILLVPKWQAVGAAVALSAMYFLNVGWSAWTGLRGIGFGNEGSNEREVE